METWSIRSKCNWKAKGKMAAIQNVKNKLCTFIPAPVPVPECTHVHPRGCRCTHKCISISPKKFSHPTSKAKDKASAMLKSVTKHYARTVHITPCILNHVSGASSTRETTYVIASRDDVRDCLERQRAWSSWSQCSPCPRMRAGVVTESDLLQTWRASWRLVIVTVVMTPPK